MWLFKLLDNRLSIAFDSFILGFLGFLFLPWTALAYAVCFAPGDLFVPRGVSGFGWILVIFAFLVDLTSYTGGEKARRERYS